MKIKIAAKLVLLGSLIVAVSYFLRGHDILTGAALLLLFVVVLAKVVFAIVSRPGSDLPPGDGGGRRPPEAPVPRPPGGRPPAINSGSRGSRRRSLSASHTMRPTIGIVALLIGSAWAALSADSTNNVSVAVTLHDSHGVSSDSAQNHVLEVILFRPHTHMHFKISNTTGQALTLWRPYCPEGDAAMSIEFREPTAPDKIFRARTRFDYTGGMGIPKVFTLAPRNDLIVNVDFQSEWLLPFALETGQIRELEMRAVYRSGPLTDDNRPFTSKEMERVWSGVATSNWQKVRIINRTGERFSGRSEDRTTQ